MKKSVRTMLQSCLIMVLVFLLAACGTSNSSKNNESASSPSKQDGNTSASNPDSNATKEKPLEITWMREERAGREVKPDSVAIQEFLKRQNVKVNVQGIPSSGFNDKKKVLIATDTLPDVLMVAQNDIQEFADTGVFLNLSNYLQLMPNFLKVIEEDPEINKNRINGDLYGFPFAAKVPDDSGLMPMMRVDLIKELGLELPKTYDEFYEVLKALKKAYPKSYPVTSRGSDNLISATTFGFGSGYNNNSGSYLYFEPNEGQYKFGPNSNEFKEAIAFLRKLYKEGLLDPDYTTNTSQIWNEKLSSGKAFFYHDNMGFSESFNKILEEAGGAEISFDMLDSLIAPSGAQRNQLYPVGHLQFSHVISAKTKEPERVIAFMDWFYSDEGAWLTNGGIEGEHYTFENGAYTLNPDLLAAHMNADSPVNSIRSYLGAGYQAFALYDYRLIEMESDTYKKWSKKTAEMLENGQGFRFVADPPFNAEERERLKQLRTQVDPYLQQNIDKFIISEGAIEKEWNQFVEELKKKGSDELVQIYNNALANVVS